MKKILLLFFAIFFISCNQDKKSSLRKEIVLDIKIEQKKLRYLKEIEWPKAYKEQDTVLLNRILGNDFKMITNNGEWSNKAEQIKRIKTTAMNHDSFWYEIKRLEVLENGTAIIAGTGHIINDNKESIYQSSNILIKRNGLWKAVLSHVSGYKEIK